MRSGDLVKIISKKENDKIAIIISYEKNPLSGILFHVLHQDGLEWVYPENIFLIEKRRR